MSLAAVQLCMMRIPQLTSDQLDGYGRGYPRPQLRRDAWWSLNGDWDFAIDAPGLWQTPDHVDWSDSIEVPFSPETAASGIENTGFYRACWYRRRIETPVLLAGQRLVLHFGAVDYRATVWINETCVGEHLGGYTPFSFDVTPQALGLGECEIIVRAEDDPHDLAKPRGKQDWQLEPHSIWYPRTTGIWQTVWMEVVPATALSRLTFTPNLARWEIGVGAWVDGVPHERLRLSVTLTSQGTVLAGDTYTVIAGEVHRRVALSDPGIDDSRNELLWSPPSPNLIEVQLDLWGERGELLDHAVSYTALRSTAVQGDRFVLNNRPYVLRLVLDQGYWPETGLTAPDDAALRKDVELAKAMGFNGVRKHQKIEDPRYLYWADRLGLAVWEEMPSAYRFTSKSVERLTREWTDAIARDYSHPCVVSWVPINESWGVPNLTEIPSERHFVQALYHLTRTLDATRPVIGNDGWESVATDIIGIHDYDDRPDRMAKRYHADEVLPRLFKRERPGGRLLVLDGNAQRHAEQPLMLTEFGGIAFAPNQKRTWGYSRSLTAEEFGQRYRDLLDVVRELQVFSGFCYTQFADTYQEANGLLFADRTPKIPLKEIAAATAGRLAWREYGLEQLLPAEED
jgi:beta-galactosidase/beta-glucuronidase